MQDEPAPSPESFPSAASTDELERLVQVCLKRMEEEGEAAVDSLCREHPSLAISLRGQIESLRRVGLLLSAETKSDARFPERLGEFRLLRKLGSGGMGVVYLAEQESLGRKVALKLIRPEQMFFPGARERFRREVEAVARLKHPGIVPIYTVGEEGGVPYFAMEWIEGVSLADALLVVRAHPASQARGEDLAGAVRDLSPATADSGAKPVEARAFGGTWEQVCCAIVRQVAHALEHAHRRGVLHRDVKPSNVILTPAGRALLVDFGLAWAEGASQMTRTGSQVGSLHYMSPEQVRGEHGRLDRRTDVYSLGVTFYEMLTLEGPFGGELSEQVRRRILEGRPAPPRSRNSRISWEAETVCLAAMELDPARRYPTAEAFARDLDNVLERRPIAARRAGPWLRARRWTQRHPAGAVAILMGLLLCAASVEFALEQRAANANIRIEKTEAEVQRDQAREVAELLAGIFQVSDPGEARGNSITAREILDRGADRIRTELAAQPVVQARLMDVIGSVYKNLGLDESARELLERALEIRRRTLGNDCEEVAHSLNNLGGWFHARQDFPAAEPLYREALEIFRRLQPQGDRSVSVSLSNLGECLRDLGRFDEAEPLLRDALAMRVRLLGAEHLEVASAMHQLARLLHSRKELDAAERLYREARAMLEKVGASEHPETAIVLHNLGGLLQERGELEQAEALLLRCLQMRRGFFEEAHPLIPITLHALASVRRAQGDLPGAEGYYRELLELRRKALPATDLAIGDSAGLVGTCLMDRGLYPEAEPLLLEYLSIGSGPGAVDGTRTRQALRALVRLYTLWGREAEALEYRNRLSPASGAREVKTDGPGR